MISSKRIAASPILVKISFICAVLFLTLPPAFAHDFWVTVSQGGNKIFKADIGYGHDFPKSEPIPEDRVHLFAPLKLVTLDDAVTLSVTATFAGFSDQNYQAFQGKTNLKGEIDIIPLKPVSIKLSLV